MKEVSEMGLVGTISGALAKRVGPGFTGPAVRAVLERAIDGVGPLPGAASSGDEALKKSGGDTDVAIDDVIDSHVKLAGAQGFLTNVGGLVTMAVSAPVNLAAVALLQCHLAAAILHIRGYDLKEPGVRDAALVCLLDADAQKELAKETKADMSPVTLAKGAHSPEVRQLINQAVTGALLTNIGGKRVAAFVARRVPFLGGAVGAAGDAWATRRIGRETAKLPRAIRPVATAGHEFIDATS